MPSIALTSTDERPSTGLCNMSFWHSAGGGPSAFLFLPVSAGNLLITLFAGWWHAVRYYVWEPPNIHHGGHHATILTFLHTSSGFQYG
jgi:hypothetical protein